MTRVFGVSIVQISVVFPSIVMDGTSFFRHLLIRFASFLHACDGGFFFSTISDVRFFCALVRVDMMFFLNRRSFSCSHTNYDLCVAIYFRLNPFRLIYAMGFQHVGARCFATRTR